MAVRNNFAAGEVLAAADLNDTFASKLPYSYGTATPSTTISGFLWYDSNSTPAAPKFWTGSAFQALTSGKILQVVRATDATQRTTTSTSFVDVTGMTVTITPTKSTSAVILLAVFMGQQPSTEGESSDYQITDSSNNAISGAENTRIAGNGASSFSVLSTIVGYATPATTSSVTYKLRFKVLSLGTATVRNNLNTGQMYAIEVGA
jgi:hypothetical protein